LKGAPGHLSFFQVHFINRNAMKSFWDERYNQAEYVYGTEPNAFLTTVLPDLKPGRLYLPGEGEGRNAVYAARLGWQVEALDQSIIGYKKARQLAANHLVEFEYHVSDWSGYQPENHFDLIGIFYLHLPPTERLRFHTTCAAMLKPGGKLIAEYYSKAQLTFGTGGPQEADLLYETQALRNDFSGINIEKLEELILDVSEGRGHRGRASVIRIIASRPDY